MKNTAPTGSARASQNGRQHLSLFALIRIRFDQTEDAFIGFVGGLIDDITFADRRSQFRLSGGNAHPHIETGLKVGARLLQRETAIGFRRIQRRPNLDERVDLFSKPF